MKGKIEKLAELLNETKKLMGEIDPAMFIMIDPKLYDGVAQVHIKNPGGLKRLMTFEKKGAIYDTGKEVSYRDYGFMIDGVHFSTSEVGA